MKYLVNTVGANMLHQHADEFKIIYKKLSREQAAAIAKDFRPAISGSVLPVLVEKDLGLEPQMHRLNIVVGWDDECLWAHYRGPMLHDPVERIPEGGEIRYYLVRFEPTM